MFRQSIQIIAAVATVAALAACGEDPAAQNQTPALTLTVDGTVETLANVVFSAKSSTAAVSLRFAGHVDPDPQLADEEYTFALNIELERSAFEALTAPATLGLDGTAAVDADRTTDTSTRTWTPGAGASAVVQLVYADHLCYCAGQDGQLSQTVTGALTLTRIEGTQRLAGHVTATVQGEFLDSSDTHTVSFDADFELDVTPQT
ncbi:MAG: hypothetical protein KC933_12565 [Myxococcales bacterium]|nr:hypothetical protein [Myxococcales bacterium]